MTATKPWYLSRTIWASIISIGVGLAGWFGLASDQIDESMITDSLVELIGAAAGLVAIFGRLRATARIG